MGKSKLTDHMGHQFRNFWEKLKLQTTTNKHLSLK